MTNTELVPSSDSMSPKDLKMQVQVIQQIMRDVMQEDVHYGEIPGMKAKSGQPKKHVLLKPGSEKIMLTFRIANELFVEDLSSEDEYRYRVRSRATHIGSGNFLGEGIGEASTSEEKYRWKSAICKEEFAATTADRRRQKWCKGYDGKPNYPVDQIRTNPADLANTVLKMAKKRAQIDMVLTVTAASDIFTQDLEDEDVVVSNDQKKADAREVETTKCAGCQAVVAEAVKDFSEKKFGKSFCMKCQKDPEKTNAKN